MKYMKMLGLAAVAAMAPMAVASSASATTLEINGVAQNRAVTISASLKSGTSSLLIDEFGTTTDTCTTSTAGGTTKTFDPPSGQIISLTFSNCTHTTTVITNGSLSAAWTSGTNGTVTSSGAEVTVQSTFFGASAVCKTGEGTKIGTLTGVATGDATMDINATINCGILGKSSWTGTYMVTSATSSTMPSGTSLGVVN